MRTGLTAIMMMFFTGIPLDITVPAVVLVGAVCLDWAVFRLRRDVIMEGEPA